MFKIQCCDGKKTRKIERVFLLLLFKKNKEILVSKKAVFDTVKSIKSGKLVSIWCQNLQKTVNLIDTGRRYLTPNDTGKNRA